MDYEGAAPPVMERKLFGVHETIELPVKSFVRPPQVRSGMNPELPNIKDSIRTRGLLNQTDAARMNEVQLGVYLDFVNRTWGTNVSIEDYAMQQQPDGNYYVIVAGYTRTEALCQLQDEDDVGYEYAMMAKVHSISTPEELIALQLDENLHSKPAQEQRAIAVVEAYQYGIESGLWSNKLEFLEQSRGKFSKQILNDALGFAQLPPQARDFVFSGRLSYNAAVALGQATDLIIEYHVVKMGYDETLFEVTPEFDEAYTKYIGHLIAQITNRNINGTAAKKFIAGQMSVLRQEIDAIRGSHDEDSLFELASPEEQRQLYLNQLTRDYRAALRDMRSTSIEAVSSSLELHRRLVGDEEIDGLDDERRERTKLFASSVLELGRVRTA